MTDVGTTIQKREFTPEMFEECCKHHKEYMTQLLEGMEELDKSIRHERKTREYLATLSSLGQIGKDNIEQKFLSLHEDVRQCLKKNCPMRDEDSRKCLVVDRDCQMINAKECMSFHQAYQFGLCDIAKVIKDRLS